MSRFEHYVLFLAVILGNRCFNFNAVEVHIMWPMENFEA
jgi:hypothetical protein